MLTYLKLMYETFLKDEEGASAVEYGLILGLIAVAAIVVLGTLGDQISGFFQSASDTIATETAEELRRTASDLA